jgi:hypothetical protein
MNQFEFVETEVQRIAVDNPSIGLLQLFFFLEIALNEVAIRYNLDQNKEISGHFIQRVYGEGLISRDLAHTYITINGKVNLIKHAGLKLGPAEAAELIRDGLKLYRKLEEANARIILNISKWLEAAENNRASVREIRRELSETKQVDDANSLEAYWRGVCDGLQDLLAGRKAKERLLLDARISTNSSPLSYSDYYNRGYFAGYISVGQHPDTTEDFYEPPQFESLYEELLPERVVV